MQVLMVCETKDEAERVNRIYEKMLQDKADGIPLWEEDGIGDGIAAREDGNVDMIQTDRPIAYYLEDGADATYTVWNFGTMERLENVEGDIAGLVNLPNGNFPF